MSNKPAKRLPKILKINKVDKDNLVISVLFSNGEDRVIDFDYVFRDVWKITPDDLEYRLKDPTEFEKVILANHTLSWNNIETSCKGLDGEKITMPYEAGADTLFELSEPDPELYLPIGSLIKKERMASGLTQNDLAQLSGTTRTYITRLESGKQDIEMKTLKKIVEAGLKKHLTITIE
jgi:DNA-binding XRE family transcriptional regulator